MSAISEMTEKDNDVWGDKKSRNGFSGIQLGINVNATNSSKDLHKKWCNHFPLDSGTVFSMLVNKELADEIVEAEAPINMITNVGEKLIDEQAKSSNESGC